MNELLHQRENNVDSENHLKDNGEKFNNHCVEVLRLLYQGKKLNARQLETEYGYDGRRLRDVAANRKDVFKKWINGSNGKTRYVEYWMQIPGIPTKHETIIKAERIINQLKAIPDKTFETLFTLDDNPPSFVQSNLFE